MLFEKIKTETQKLKKTKLAQRILLQQDAIIDLDKMLFFDYSCNFYDDETIGLFKEIGQKTDLQQKIDAMFSGEKINNTENRAVLHTALRANHSRLMVDGVNVAEYIKNEKQRLYDFAEQIIKGERRGITDKKFKYVVNIGIGGSHLGVEAAYQALQDYKNKDIELLFVANVDSKAMEEVLAKINLEETLFIISSKSFTTEEVMLNAKIVTGILHTKFGKESLAKHLCAVTSNLKAAQAMGLARESIFSFGDYIGGRFSMWGPIGLGLVITLGVQNFESLLEGACLMDKHFREAPWEKNMVILHSMFNVLYNIGFSSLVKGLFVYSHNLQFFPSYIQQVAMESNGKGVDKDGKTIDFIPSAVILGGTGTNIQHSFFQFLHQTNLFFHSDFIGVLNTKTPFKENQKSLFVNMVAQSEALALGTENMPDYKKCLGNKPSNIILLKEITPKSFGMLCSFYENSVFVEGAVFNVNSFDQFGVELGKERAKLLSSGIKNDKMLKSRLLFLYETSQD